MRVSVIGIAILIWGGILSGQSFGQMFTPAPLGTSYGMFGPRTVGTPLAPQARTLFASGPRSRPGVEPGTGLGGPMHALWVEEVNANAAWVPPDLKSLPFRTAQAQATEAALGGIRSAIPRRLTVTLPPEWLEAPAAQPVRSPARRIAPAESPLESEVLPMRSP